MLTGDGMWSESEVSRCMLACTAVFEFVLLLLPVGGMLESSALAHLATGEEDAAEGRAKRPGGWAKEALFSRGGAPRES